MGWDYGEQIGHVEPPAVFNSRSRGDTAAYQRCRCAGVLPSIKSRLEIGSCVGL